MSITAQIVEAWGRPRPVMARLIAAGDVGGRAASYLMVAGVLYGIANLANAQLVGDLAEGGQPAGALIAARVFQVALGALGVIVAGIVVGPLSHLVARLFGGKAGWRGGSLALFWAMLASAPFALLSALLLGLAVILGGRVLGEASFLVGMAGQLMLIHVWSGSLAEAEGFAKTWPVALVMLAIGAVLFALSLQVPTT
ncbi:hypothetical protein [Roseobacter sp. HKCCA0434]|uniref:hypothetical protein n=1 Tax=Roseobacter sp. HKCCA0434 TaxID=3079297 RepID=UPI002905A79A|nr:hypothetical protein [Roseobacter sp. HKCCA0434]